MAPRPEETSARLLSEYAREPGRSALARVETPGAQWEGGIAADVPRPAASLLKVPLALAVEDAFASGRLDPDAAVTVAGLTGARSGPQPLRALRPGLRLTAADVLGLCLVLSDNTCASRLLEAVGLAAVRRAAAAAGCAATVIGFDEGSPGGPLTGTTTARDALRLLAASRDTERFPRTSLALENAVHASRIPLGATGDDVRVAHKTGTLSGVANDVAVIDCAGGTVQLAFLTERQHDLLVTGYEMGICTRGLLEAWGLRATATRSLL